MSTDKQKTTRSLIKWTHPFYSNLLSLYGKHETGVFYHLVILYWIRCLKLDENKTEKGIIQIIVKYRGLIDFRFDKCSKMLGEVVAISRDGLRVTSKSMEEFSLAHSVVYSSTGWNSGYAATSLCHVVLDVFTVRRDHYCRLIFLSQQFRGVFST